MTDPHARATAIKHCLEYVFSPDPHMGPGTTPTPAEQTIEADQTTSIGPQDRSDFRPSEGEYHFVSKQPARSTVEAQGGRAAS
jgi:hypothetical protein